MILVDTSIWINHFRNSNAELCENLLRGSISSHSMIIGELACGNLPHRKRTLSYLSHLPLASCSLDREIMYFIDTHKLMGRGIGYADAHLLTSAMISGHKLWSADKRLRAIALELGVAHVEEDD